MGDVSPPPDPISSAQSANERHGPSRSPLGLGTTITTITTTTTVQDHEIDCPSSDADAGSQLNPDSPMTKPLPHVVATSSQATAEPLKPVFAMPPPPPPHLLQDIPRTSVIFSPSNAMEAPDPIKKPEKGSATLVWWDVTVTTTGGGGCKRLVEVAPPTKVLKSNTGFARPGSVLSIMGSACSGKNILLKSLAGNINTRST